MGTRVLASRCASVFLHNITYQKEFLVTAVQASTVPGVSCRSHSTRWHGKEVELPTQSPVVGVFGWMVTMKSSWLTM